jgi:FHS family L-fucose permease-like MFS transporter
MCFALAAGFLTWATVFVQGIFGLYGLVLISFFLSMIFPTIYGIALADLTEEQAKVGSAGLVIAIVGVP